MHALPAVFLASVALVDVTDAVQCNATYTWYKWATNHDGQDPCQLVSDLHDLCAPSAHPFQPLSYDPSRINFYPGPKFPTQDICTCSYVMYNLMSACGDCQVGLSAPAVWPAYTDWAQACGADNAGGIYPNAIPGSFSERIPIWARLSANETGDVRWSYGLSHAIALGHFSIGTKLELDLRASSGCPPHSSPALPIGTAFAGLVAGVILASFGVLLHRNRRARVIPPPTRYHTAPDNTPLHPLVPRPAHAQGTNFLRRILEYGHENDPRRIEPFDISAAVGTSSFPPHPAAFPAMRGYTIPPAAGPTRGPSRQPSSTSLDANAFTYSSPLCHVPSLSRSKSGSRPQTAVFRFSASGSPVPGPSMVPLQNISPSEPPSPLPLDRNRPAVLEDPPAYRRKS